MEQKDSFIRTIERQAIVWGWVKIAAILIGFGLVVLITHDLLF